MNLIRNFKGKKYQWISSYSTKEETKKWAKKFGVSYRIVENKEGFNLYQLIHKHNCLTNDQYKKKQQIINKLITDFNDPKVAKNLWEAINGYIDEYVAYDSREWFKTKVRREIATIVKKGCYGIMRNS